MTREKQIALSVKDITKTYGKKKAADHVSFDIYSGEIFGFLGPNGAGKTTVIKSILGFVFPDGGEVYINGYSTKTHYEEAMASVGGIVENPEMYMSLSARQNIKMYAELHGDIPKERIDQVITEMGLSGRADEPVKKYSLGMKQRIGLAQAMVHKPRLLILDEPTNGLDPTGIHRLRDVLKKYAHEEDAAVMVSSHILSEMQLLCDRVGIINNGRLISIYSMDEVCKTQSSLEDIFLQVTGGGIDIE